MIAWRSAGDQSGAGAVRGIAMLAEHCRSGPTNEVVADDMQITIRREETA